MNALSQLALESPPEDTVADLAFCQTEAILAAASWDNSLHMWRSEDGFQTAKKATTIKDTTKDAILRCAFKHDDATLFYGTARGAIKKVDPKATASTDVGTHIGVITGLKWSSEKNCIVVGSSDFVCKLWDPKTSKATVECKLPDRCIALDALDSKIAIAMPGQKIVTIDVRQPDKIHTRETSQLTKQLTTIALCPADKGIVVGSADGGVEWRFNGDSVQFAGHRDDAQSFAYQVNIIKAWPTKPGVMSGGSDGCLATYNLEHKKRGPGGGPVSPSRTPVTALDVSPAGDLYAVAVGYDWTKGVDQSDKKPPVEVFMRKLNPNDFG